MYINPVNNKFAFAQCEMRTATVEPFALKCKDWETTVFFFWPLSQEQNFLVELYLRWTCKVSAFNLPFCLCMWRIFWYMFLHMFPLVRLRAFQMLSFYSCSGCQNNYPLQSEIDNSKHQHQSFAWLCQYNFAHLI